MKGAPEPAIQTSACVAVSLQPLLLSARDAARVCGISSATWWSMDSAGQIPRKLRVGKRCLWRTEDLILWVRWNLPNREQFEARKAQLEQTVVGNVRLTEATRK